MSSLHFQKSDKPPFIRLSFMVYIYCNQEGACKQHLQRGLRTQESYRCFSNLLSNEQECYTRKSPSCKEYELPNALLIYGNSTRISYPNLT